MFYILKMDFSKLNYWIQVFNLLLECINPRFGESMDKRLGPVVATDNGVFCNNLCPFIRVRAQLDVNETLPDDIKITKKSREKEILPIRIENLEFFCFRCSKLGHNSYNCPLGSIATHRTVDLKKKKYAVGLRGCASKEKRGCYPPLSCY